MDHINNYSECGIDSSIFNANLAAQRVWRGNRFNNYTICAVKRGNMKPLNVLTIVYFLNILFLIVIRVVTGLNIDQ